MIEIPLTRGKVAIIDDEDADLVLSHKWCAGSNGYALRNPTVGKRKQKTVYLHRELMGFPDMEVDHIDGDRLNNQRANLRLCTHVQNNRNGGIARNNTSGVKGASWLKGKLHTQICASGKRIFLGRFSTAREAAIAYNEAAKKYHGDFARLNPI